MKRVLAFGLVTLQIVLLAALLLIPHGSLWPRGALLVLASLVLDAVGLALMLAGTLALGSAFTASPIPRENTQLATRGVYGYIRNPIYTGFLTFGLGLTLYGASVWHILLWLALVALLSGKARWEERMLAAAHPTYRDYASRVGRFLPGLGRLRRPPSEE
ncbi:isoprenylcysteine carboxylmethyltransferase family protein [Leifsonia sp. YAF41]|uniref:methyltransferase family protein n=1 Tax=Leifsonia sp. YAF41 TaxID=3233086 RepID=UPI003F9BAD63